MDNIAVHTAIWREKEIGVEMEGRKRISQHDLKTGRRIISLGAIPS